MFHFYFTCHTSFSFLPVSNSNYLTFNIIYVLNNYNVIKYIVADMDDDPYDMPEWWRQVINYNIITIKSIVSITWLKEIFLFH